MDNTNNYDFWETTATFGDWDLNWIEVESALLGINSKKVEPPPDPFLNHYLEE